MDTLKKRIKQEATIYSIHLTSNVHLTSALSSACKNEGGAVLW